MNFIRILADTAGANQGSMWITLLSMPILLLLFYFIAIRPQKKKDREDAAMRSNLMVGDEITTIGGIIGRVVSIKDETCVIETSKACTKIRILKTAIRSVDVPVSATKGYVAPTTEKVADTEEKTEKKAKKK